MLKVAIIDHWTDIVIDMDQDRLLFSQSREKFYKVCQSNCTELHMNAVFKFIPPFRAIEVSSSVLFEFSYIYISLDD